MPHPNADKLQMVEVTTGVSLRPIVCGAHNFKVGDRVPVALPGARLPGDVTIRRATIRGEVSEGMLCSASELGVADDHPASSCCRPTPSWGAEVTKVLGLDDVILDIEVTPNRPDAMSLLGIAREVAAITGGHVTFPALRMNRATPGSPPVEELAAVTVEDSAGAPRYLARVITGVTPGPSPDWVGKRLAGRRGPADLQHRRRHELRPARDRPPPARLRPRQGVRLPDRGAPRGRGREDRHHRRRHP